MITSYSNSYTRKASSLALLVLLALSPLGIIFALAPLVPAAHAASGPSISVTPTTGYPGYECNDGNCNFETLVTVTGTGFPTAEQVDICFVVTSTTASTACTGGLDLGFSGGLFDYSIETPGAPACTPVCEYVQSDANGYFQVQFYAPIAEAGTYNVYAVYTVSGVPTMTSPIVFTLTQTMAVEDYTTGTNSGIPGQPFDVIVAGMANAEDLEFVGTFAVGADWLSAIATTGSAPAPIVAGYCTGADCPGVFEVDSLGATPLGTLITGTAFSGAPASDEVPPLPTGSNTVSLIGETSGLTASSTFTATPAISLFSTSTCTPPYLLSTPPGAANKFYMCGVGFAKSATIAASGSVTVGGVSTIESSISTGSTGAFGPVEITLASSTSIGPLTISFDGMNFNFASGNIEGPGIFLGSTTGAALTSVQDYTLGTYTATGNVGDTVYIFGFGYDSGQTPITYSFNGAALPLTCLYGGATCAAAVVTADTNGAFEATFIVPALPFTTPACVAGTASCYTIHDTNVVETPPVTAPDQTFTIKPEATFGGSEVTTGTANAVQAIGSLAFTYVSPSAELVNAYMGDYLTLTSGADASNTLEITASAAVAAGGVETLTLASPGLAAAVAVPNSFLIWSSTIGSTSAADNSFGFSQLLEVSGFATTSDSNTVTVTMNGVDWVTSPSVYDCATCTLVGANGQLTLLTLPIIGSTQTIDFPGGSYYVNGSGTTSGNWAVTTNQLTVEPIQAESGIPVAADVSALSVNSGPAGTTVALLSATSGGLHGLAANTAYTIMYDGTVNVGSFTSTASGEVPIGISFTIPAEPAGLHIVDIQTKGVSALYGNQLTSGQQWGGETCSLTGSVCDLIFEETPVLTATPSLVGAGETATVQGTGLPPSTVLYVIGPDSISYASFTSTATGGVPSGVTFTVPTMSSGFAAGVGYERGTTEVWCIADSSLVCGTAGLGWPYSGVATLDFVYGATASLSASSGAAGSSVTITGVGLVAGATYDVVFNCIPNVNSPFTCTGVATGATPGNMIVGALIANILGSASSTVTIPAAATAGTYVIQLTAPYTVNGIGDEALASPLTFTVGAPSGIGVTTLTPGTPSQSTINGQPDITLTYTSTLSTSSITIVGYAVVTNALGQVVLYTTASATLAPSGSQTLYFVLAGLPAGSYTVSIYAISSTGLVVSTITSATAVIS